MVDSIYKQAMLEGIHEYKQLLIGYYETEDTAAIKHFLFGKCLARLS